MLKTIAAITVSGLALVSVASAAASASFEYDASELRSRAATQRLYDRMEASAKDACRSEQAYRALYAAKAERACRAELLASWVAEINDPNLNDIYAQKSAQQRVASAR